MFVQFVEGPLWYFSATVFVIGVAVRLLFALRMGTATPLSKPRGSASQGAIRAVFSRFVPRREFRPRMRLEVIAGYAFHLGLFALLFFAAPHIEFYKDYIFGFAWPAMPRWAFIVVSEIAFAGLLVLWLRRMLHPVSRKLSDAGDHIGSILVFMVMLTGCLALDQSHESLRVLHFFLAELLLIYFPFSSLMHTFTFVFSRGYLGASFARHGVKA
ncbi:MAG: hypothetical protein ABF290_02055 [Thiogranum sp.]|jgi:nitrate reductase gamma subunit